MSGYRAEQENGVRPEDVAEQIRSPAFSQYRIYRGSCPSAKAGHWGNLRRQGRGRRRYESGELLYLYSCTKNGYGSSMLMYIADITFFIFRLGRLTFALRRRAMA